jgi:hypothetical protein
VLLCATSAFVVEVVDVRMDMDSCDGRVHKLSVSATKLTLSATNNDRLRSGGRSTVGVADASGTKCSGHLPIVSVLVRCPPRIARSVEHAQWQPGGRIAYGVDDMYVWLFEYLGHVRRVELLARIAARL